MLVEEVRVEELKVHGVVKVEVSLASQEYVLVLDVSETLNERIEKLAVHASGRINANLPLH